MAACAEEGVERRPDSVVARSGGQDQMRARFSVGVASERVFLVVGLDGGYEYEF
jgi:hypothetical protein